MNRTGSHIPRSSSNLAPTSGATLRRLSHGTRPGAPPRRGARCLRPEPAQLPLAEAPEEEKKQAVVDSERFPFETRIFVEKKNNIYIYIYMTKVLGMLFFVALKHMEVMPMTFNGWKPPERWRHGTQIQWLVDTKIQKK